MRETTTCDKWGFHKQCVTRGRVLLYVLEFHKKEFVTKGFFVPDCDLKGKNALLKVTLQLI